MVILYPPPVSPDTEPAGCLHDPRCDDAFLCLLVTVMCAPIRDKP